MQTSEMIIRRSRTTLPALDHRFDELRETERTLLRSMAVALLTGDADPEARRRLRELREDMEAIAAAERLLRLAVTPSPVPELV